MPAAASAIEPVSAPQSLRPHEPAFLQPLVKQAELLLVPVKDLQEPATIAPDPVRQKLKNSVRLRTEFLGNGHGIKHIKPED